MRFVKPLIVIPAMALLMMSCAPRRPCPHGPGGPGGPWKGKAGMEMMHHGGCGPDSCHYKSKCFSTGAVQSHAGVCQECSGGKWVNASGCREGCDGMKHGKKKPCDGHAHGHQHPHR